jgi:hypothetical protein
MSKVRSTSSTFNPRDSVWVALPVVARRLGLPRQRVLNLIRDRQLDAKLVGGVRWFVAADAITAYRRSQRQDRQAA